MDPVAQPQICTASVIFASETIIGNWTLSCTRSLQENKRNGLRCFSGEWDFFAHQQAAIYASLQEATRDSGNTGDSGA